MNREKGVSSLALVLMLLVLGSLLLQGMSQQDRSFASRVSMESQSLRRQAIVQSALECSMKAEYLVESYKVKNEE